MWTRDDQEQIQLVARAGFEPGTASLKRWPLSHAYSFFTVTTFCRNHRLQSVQWLTNLYNIIIFIWKENKQLTYNFINAKGQITMLTS